MKFLPKQALLSLFVGMLLLCSSVIIFRSIHISTVEYKKSLAIADELALHTMESIQQKSHSYSFDEQQDFFESEGFTNRTENSMTKTLSFVKYDVFYNKTIIVSLQPVKSSFHYKLTNTRTTVHILEGRIAHDNKKSIADLSTLESITSWS